MPAANAEEESRSRSEEESTDALANAAVTNLAEKKKNTGERRGRRNQSGIQSIWAGVKWVV